MDRLDDFRDWLYRKLCGHAQAPEFREITNTWDGKEHYNAFWECSRCGEVLSSEYMWTIPEGSKVIFPDSGEDGK